MLDVDKIISEIDFLINLLKQNLLVIYLSSIISTENQTEYQFLLFPFNYYFDIFPLFGDKHIKICK